MNRPGAYAHLRRLPPHGRSPFRSCPRLVLLFRCRSFGILSLESFQSRTGDFHPTTITPVPGVPKKVPVKIRPGQWYKLNVEIVGDRMRVMIDDQRVGSLQSPGLAHPTKPDLRIGVWGEGEEAWFDDLRIWSVRPVASVVSGSR